MMRDRVAARLGCERGFTLIEILVVIILIGILAAIALAVFLRQQDKGRDSSAKSDVTNLVHEVQACNAGTSNPEDFRGCDTASELGQTNLPIGTDAPQTASGDCSDPPAAATVTSGSVRVYESGPDCFVVLGISKSGNHFWYVKHNGGGFSRNCTTQGVNGCPTSGVWAG